MRALVKGGGPSGLAAATALAQEGFDVHLVEKRPWRPEGAGRKNMVAIRPEALHQLDLLGALQYAREKGTITPITSAVCTNEMDGSVLTWPLDSQQRYPVEDGDQYKPPEQISQQWASSYINLGHLEDHLTRAALQAGVKVSYDATIELVKSEPNVAEGGEERYQVILHQKSVPPSEDLGIPDLIVCASGKNDLSLAHELGFRRHIGVRLEQEILPMNGKRRLLLASEHELESQLFCVFGVTMPNAQMGIFNLNVRKDMGQPVVEIVMQHAGASHYLMQLPRGLPNEDIENYVNSRVKDRLSTTLSADKVVWGDPKTPFLVETSTAPQYAFGSNVVLVGDAGMSCSPSPGLGADIGLTHDVQCIRRLARQFKICTENGDMHEKIEALNHFNVEKAHGVIMWSQGSRRTYLPKKKADEILASVSMRHNRVSQTVA